MTQTTTTTTTTTLSKEIMDTFEKYYGPEAEDDEGWDEAIIVRCEKACQAETENDDDELDLGISKPHIHSRCIMCSKPPTRAWILQDFVPPAKYNYGGITEPNAGQTFALCDRHHEKCRLVFTTYAKLFCCWTL